jgi:hypothetical protein
MATKNYITGRQKYSSGRPQAMLWSDNPGTISDGFYVPLGTEVGGESFVDEEGSFIILSDHNREPIDFSFERIENRQRMINGRMRSYHVADKLNISTSWTMLPSRAYPLKANFSSSTGEVPEVLKGLEYTVDGGAGGVEMLDWYKNNSGSFWVFLSYDNYTNFPNEATEFSNLNKYSEIVEVFFSDFTYTVAKRGGSNYDMWDISVTLEEV